jgi:autotransporter-associated beta strand protein
MKHATEVLTAATAVMALILTILPAVVRADTIDYTGADNGLWSVVGNWDSDPNLPGSSDVARIDSGASINFGPYLDINTAVGGVAFVAGGAYIRDDGTHKVLSIGASGVDGPPSGNSVSFDAPVNLTASQEWDNPPGNTIYLAGTVDGVDYVQGGSSVTLTKTGEGTLHVRGGDNSFAGTIHLKEGALTFYDDGAVGDEFGTGGLVLGDSANPTAVVRLGVQRTGNVRQINSLADGIRLDGDLMTNSTAGGATIQTGTSVPWTIGTGPLRTVYLNQKDNDPDDSLKILAAIGDEGAGRGLRFQGENDFDPATDGLRKVTLGGENTFTGELQVAPGVVVNLDDPDTGNAAAVLNSAVVVRLESDRTYFGKLNLVDAVNVEVAGLYLGGVAQGPGTYNAGTNSDYFSGAGSLVVLVPEPATMGLLGLGSLGIAMLRVRRRRK